MKICIVGAGSLGSAIGGTLAKNGHDVVLVDPYQEHIRAINQNRLLMRSELDGPATSIKVRATDTYPDIPPQDLVILLVMSFATRDAIRQVKQTHILGPETLVMTIQNGLGNEETIMEEIGEKNLISGKTYVSGLLVRPGEVMAAVAGRKTVIGEMRGERSVRTERLAVELSHSGLETQVSDNIRGLIWEKLFVNVATGAISGITGLTYGQTYDTYGGRPVEPGIKETAIAAVNESITVAKAGGVAVSCQDAQSIWYSAAQRQPISFKISILQSLERGIATEIDYINGAVVREGRRWNVATPVNDTLTACIRGMECRMGLREAARGGTRRSACAGPQLAPPFF